MLLREQDADMKSESYSSVAPPPIASASPPIAKLDQGTSLWKDAWYRLQKNRIALFGLWAFCAVTLLCLLGPFFTGYSYEQTEISLKASAPMEPVFLRSEAHKNGEVRKSFIAFQSARRIPGQAKGGAETDCTKDRRRGGLPGRQRLLSAIESPAPVRYRPAWARFAHPDFDWGADLARCRVCCDSRFGCDWGSLGRSCRVRRGKDRYCDDAYGGYSLRSPLRGHRYIADGNVRAKFYSAFCRNRMCRMVNHGPYCSWPDHLVEESGVYRSGNLSGASKLSDIAPASDPERSRPDHYLFNAYVS